MNYKGRYTLFDARAITTYPIKTRKNKVTYDDVLSPEQIASQKFELSGEQQKNIRTVAKHVIQTRQEKKPVLFFTPLEKGKIRHPQKAILPRLGQIHGSELEPDIPQDGQGTVSLVRSQQQQVIVSRAGGLPKRPEIRILQLQRGFETPGPFDPYETLAAHFLSLTIESLAAGSTKLSRS